MLPVPDVLFGGGGKVVGAMVVVGGAGVVVGATVVVIAAVVVGAAVVVVGGAEACAWAGAVIELMIGFVQLLGRMRAVATPPITTLRTCRRSCRFNSICRKPLYVTRSAWPNVPIPPVPSSSIGVLHV